MARMILGIYIGWASAFLLMHFVEFEFQTHSMDSIKMESNILNYPFRLIGVTSDLQIHEVVGSTPTRFATISHDWNGRALLIIAR